MNNEDEDRDFTSYNEARRFAEQLLDRDEHTCIQVLVSTKDKATGEEAHAKFQGFADGRRDQDRIAISYGHAEPKINVYVVE